MSCILGLDISTYVGCTAIDNSEIRSKLIHFKEYTGFKRLQLIAQSVHSTIEEWKPELVIIEGYALGSKNNLQLMVECGTVVRQSVYAHKLSWWEVAPTVLKQFTTGKGNAKKPDMAKAVQERWGFTSKSDDIIDAYALAKFGELLVAEPEKYTALKGVKYHAYK